MTPHKDPTLAQTFFQVRRGYLLLEDYVEEALLRACGIDPEGDWPIGNFSFDDYDNSFEFNLNHKRRMEK